jgi:RHS repeat-associated protein
MNNSFLRHQHVSSRGISVSSKGVRSKTLLSYALALVCMALLIAEPARAQIAFRAATSATAAGITPAFRSAASAATTGAALTITRPSGVAANDVLIASLGVTPSTVAIVAPSGWTLVRRMDNAGPIANTLAVYYKVASASEPASYAWGVSGSGFTVGGVQAFTGIDTTAPIESENGQATASATTHATPSLTTSMANAMVVTSHAFASARTWTPPSGMTESFDQPSGANNATGMSIEGARVVQAVAGATGVKTATSAGNADAGNTHILVLKPRTVNLSLSTPASTQPNDVMIAAVGFSNSSAAIAPPSGWTLVRRVNNTAATSNTLAVYWRRAQAGEPSSHAWAISGGTFLVGGIQAFSGVDSTTPFDVENGQTTPSATAHDTPSVTTTDINRMLVTAHTYASAQTWTPQAGLSEGFDRPSGANNATGQSIAGGHQLQAAAGATGAKRSTAGGNADVGNTHILALRHQIPNTAPTVSLTSPATGASFIAPASITLAASAADTDGTIQKVEFFQGATLLNTDSTAPYSFDWTSVPAGSYALTAKATDNAGGVSTSAVVNISVVANNAPSVTLTAPANGASYTAPASITLAANATDSDGSIAQVEFFQGATLLNTDTVAPYNFDWTNVAAGTYTLTARATDNLGSTATSTGGNITVTAPPALYYIHPDHLNTPRVITNQAQQVVWRWDNDDPFGGNMANENPSGLGTFTCNLRFPGQYFVRETNMHYNYFRDYSPEIGRYIESDPIGLDGGINTYAYVGGNPVSLTDPDGRIPMPQPGPPAITAPIQLPGSPSGAGSPGGGVCGNFDYESCRQMCWELSKFLTTPGWYKSCVARCGRPNNPLF